MASTKSRAGTRADGAAAIDPAQYQQGSQQRLALAAETTAQLIRGAEIWGQLQLRALQRSGQTWREAAERMRTATSPLDLIGAQNHVLMNSFVQSLQFAQEFLQASVAVQQGTATQTAQAEGEAQEQASGAAESVMSSMMQTPMAQAWQSMMNPMGLNGTGAAAR